MSLHSLIANGGKVVIVGGTMNKAWEPYRDHPQLVFWCGDRSEIERHLRNGDNLPHNVKGVVISRFISHQSSGKVMDEAKRKRAVIFASKNDGQITEILDEMTRVEPKVESKAPEAPPAPPKELRAPKPGEIQTALEKHYVADVPNIDAARRLLGILAEQGIKTTEESLQQAIYQYKKKLGIVSPRAHAGPYGRTIKPASAPVIGRIEPAPAAETTTAPTAIVETVVGREEVVTVSRTVVPNEVDEITPLIQMVDDSLAVLGMVREHLVRLNEDSKNYRHLKSQLEAMMKTLGMK